CILIFYFTDSIRDCSTEGKSPILSAITVNTSLAFNTVSPLGRIYDPFLLIITINADFGKSKSTILLSTANASGDILISLLEDFGSSKINRSTSVTFLSSSGIATFNHLATRDKEV